MNLRQLREGGRLNIYLRVDEGADTQYLPETVEGRGQTHYFPEILREGESQSDSHGREEEWKGRGQGRTI